MTDQTQKLTPAEFLAELQRQNAARRQTQTAGVHSADGSDPSSDGENDEWIGDEVDESELDADFAAGEEPPTSDEAGEDRKSVV